MLEAPVVDQRILRGVAATLSWQNVDQDGDNAAPSGTVTIGVNRADGTVLVAPLTATSGTSTDPRTYLLTAPLNTLLDILTVTWTDAGDSSTHVTLVEVCGGYFFTLADARGREASLVAEKYPDVDVLDARRAVEDEFEQIAGVAFVPRYRRARLKGNGRCHLPADDRHIRTVRTVTEHTSATSSTVWTAGQRAEIVVNDGGILTLLDGSTWPDGRELVVEYEHGLDRLPGELKRWAILRARQHLNSSAIDPRAAQYTTGDGTIVFALVPGERRTGVPELDAALLRHRDDSRWLGIA